MYLLFDIGGTNARFAISSDGKTLSDVKIVPTPRDFQQGVDTIKQIADECSTGQKIQAVAGGLAGPLDKNKTMLISSPHIGEWINKPFKSELEKALGVPVFLENDANLAGLGEASFGAEIDKNIVAYLTISTGVGGVRVVNKQIDKSSFGFEPGHQIIVIDGNLCNCGGKGHLEAYIGGYYLEKIYGKKSENLDDPAIWDQVARYLAIGLQNTIVHWSPDVIILGGSVTKSIDIDNLKNHLSEIMHVFPESPEIVKASLGNQAGLYGALYLLK